MLFTQYGFKLTEAECEDASLDPPKLGHALFAKLGDVLQPYGLKLGTGTDTSTSTSTSTSTIIQATIIGPPSSTKNTESQPEPETQRIHKRKPRYSGMKLHIGVDGWTRLPRGAGVA